MKAAVLAVSVYSHFTVLPDAWGGGDDTQPYSQILLK